MNRIVGIVGNEILDVLNKISHSDMGRLERELLGASRIFGAGVGRSGLMIKAFIMRLNHLGLEAYAVGETATPGARPSDLFVIGSGSGETGTLAALAQKAKGMDMRVALLTANPKSTLAQKADFTLEIPVPVKSVTGAAASVQPGGTLFEQSLLLVFDAVIVSLMYKKGISENDMLHIHANLE